MPYTNSILRIKLTEEDLKSLVMGKEIEKIIVPVETESIAKDKIQVKMILEDCGYDRIITILEEKMKQL